MKLELKEETLQKAFQNAMENIEIQTGMNLLECVEKQMPCKPGTVQADGDDIIICPSCGHFLGYAEACEEELFQCNYCPWCGQKIDWSE